MESRQHHRGVLVIFFGLTGSGKSYLAKEWARRSGCLYFNTDVVRKELAAKDGRDQGPQGFGQGIYSGQYSLKTYDALRRYAEASFSGAEPACVVLDGSYQQRQQRVLLMEQFSGRVAMYFVLCFCNEEVTRTRLRRRMQDSTAVSDGTLEIFCKQRENFEAPDEISPHQLLELDTNGSLENLVEKLDRFLKQVKKSNTTMSRTGY
ncbi:AAA family ATPase [Desulfopila sp. IMCC35008]|uniref:AAA family ATPase n=1 Tax=Desulfopila sp. IMCC35008 TaxID=2653858 RepID=UPI0013D2C60C|nr:AAA family ATPase [Desulfopila sp. IMCC35008]